MISPELVRRYPFFWCIDDAQQKAIAMISEDVTFEKGTVIFQEGQQADLLYFLMEGSVALCIRSGAEADDTDRRFYVAHINPGEPFGIAAMLANERYTSFAEATTKCRVIRIDGVELRKLLASDCGMGYCLLQQMGKAALERLRLAYIELAAARG